MSHFDSYSEIPKDVPPRIPSEHPMSRFPYPCPQSPRSRVPAYGCLGCGCFASLFLVFMIASVFYAGILEMAKVSSSITRKHLSGPEATVADSRVAVIQVQGTLADTDGFLYDQIENVLRDSTIQAVVLRIESPGGTVSASDFFYNKLTKLRTERQIPVVVSMGGICASGGYYVAMACGNETPDVIFAEPTTWTGSIGVILSHYDLSKLAEKIGISEDALRSHELKGMGSLFRPLTDQERDILQNLVDDAFLRFQEVVYSGRKTFADDHAKLQEIATGQVFTTQAALQNGLVDKQGYLEDALDRAMELAGLNKENTEVFTYKKADTLGSLLSATHEKMDENALSIFRESVSPRAYYLWAVGQ